MGEIEPPMAAKYSPVLAIFWGNFVFPEPAARQVSTLSRFLRSRGEISTRN